MPLSNPRYNRFQHWFIGRFCSDSSKESATSMFFDTTCGEGEFNFFHCVSSETKDTANGVNGDIEKEIEQETNGVCEANRDKVNQFKKKQVKKRFLLFYYPKNKTWFSLSTFGVWILEGKKNCVYRFSFSFSRIQPFHSRVFNSQDSNRLTTGRNNSSRNIIQCYELFFFPICISLPYV